MDKELESFITDLGKRNPIEGGEDLSKESFKYRQALIGFKKLDKISRNLARSLDHLEENLPRARNDLRKAWEELKKLKEEEAETELIRRRLAVCSITHYPDDGVFSLRRARFLYRRILDEKLLILCLDHFPKISERSWESPFSPQVNIESEVIKVAGKLVRTIDGQKVCLPVEKNYKDEIYLRLGLTPPPKKP